ncbi:MAG: glycosyltransferase family 1 protein [Dorea sp.]|nr:glycosyltransferase family 1 protein [Dorea sp.]
MEIIKKKKEEQPIRVLHVIHGLGSGGAESILMGLFKNVDRNKYHFDFLIRSKNNIYEKDIKQLGGCVYTAPPFPSHIIKNYKYTKNLIKSKKYSVIHVHGNALIYVYPLIIAKRLGIPCRIMHSHNTSAAKKVYYPIHIINKYRIRNVVNIRLACSEAAGNWMFGKDKFYIVENGINISQFKFNQDVRMLYRNRLGIRDKFVIGNVARFLPSKNHFFLLKIFREILEQMENALLILIGEGPEEEKIKKLAEELGMNDSIIFLGKRNDVNCLMQAMDIFILPSNFEGLGIVLIEAQAASLPCVASDIIPKESKISELIEYVSLNSPPHIWAEQVLKLYKTVRREENSLSLQESSYNIEKCAKKLEKIYSKALDRS